MRKFRKVLFFKIVSIVVIAFFSIGVFYPNYINTKDVRATYKTKHSLRISMANGKRKKYRFAKRFLETANTIMFAIGLGTGIKNVATAQTIISTGDLKPDGIEKLGEALQENSGLIKITKHDRGNGFYYAPLAGKDSLIIKGERLYEGRVIDPDGNVIGIVENYDIKLIRTENKDGKIVIFTPLPEFNKIYWHDTTEKDYIDKYWQTPARLNYLARSCIVSDTAGVKMGEKLDEVYFSNEELKRYVLSFEERKEIIYSFVDSLKNIIKVPNNYLTNSVLARDKFTNFIRTQVHSLIEDITEGKKKIKIFDTRENFLGLIDFETGGYYNLATGEIGLNCSSDKVDMGRIIYNLLHEIIGHEHFDNTEISKKIASDLWKRFFFSEIFAQRISASFLKDVKHMTEVFRIKLIRKNPKYTKSFRIGGVPFDSEKILASLPAAFNNPAFLMLYLLDTEYYKNVFINLYINNHPETQDRNRYDIFIAFLNDIKNQIESLGQSDINLMSEELFITQKDIEKMISYLESAISYYEKVECYITSRGTPVTRYRDDFTDKDGVIYKKGTIINAIESNNLSEPRPCIRILIKGKVIFPSGREIKIDTKEIPMTIDEELKIGLRSMRSGT